MVSLKSWSSVEFKIENTFLNFVFFEDLSRLKILCEHVTFARLCSHLAQFLFKLRPFIKIVF